MHSLYINNRFQNQRISGVQRVARELSKRLECTFNIQYTKNPHHGLKGHIYEQLSIPSQLNKQQLLFSPSNLGPLSHKNQIVMIHDLATFDHPEWFNSQFQLAYRYLTPMLAKRVKAIITVSEYSKSRIIYHLPIADENVHVIPLGVDSSFYIENKPTINSQALRKKYQIGDKPYLLSLCSIDPRKNIRSLVKSWLALPHLHKDFNLVIAGGNSRPFTNQKQLNHTSIYYPGFIDDHDLPCLYQHAKAFAYPSLYEGFGLPPLEAMAAGLPVLASNQTSIPEVVKDRAILVNPLDINDISHNLEQMLTTQNYNPQYNINHAKQFNWSQSANKLENIIKGYL